MGSMKEICQKLDEIVDEFFTVQQELLSQQYLLEQRLKDAFFLMSKARYTMGVKSVSSLQYNENDLAEADVTVSVDDNKSFTVVQKTDQSCQEKETNMRKRGVQTEKTDYSSKDLQPQKNKVHSLQKNPINWFGILVPQSLRQCQAQFRTVPDIICVIATLKAQYTECLSKYHSLLEKKQLLLNDSFEKLEIES